MKDSVAVIGVDNGLVASKPRAQQDATTTATDREQADAPEATANEGDGKAGAVLAKATTTESGSTTVSGSP